MLFHSNISEHPNLQELAETFKSFCLEFLNIEPKNHKIICLSLSDTGYYCHDDRNIRISTNIESSTEFVLTIFHECRHCYQYSNLPFYYKKQINHGHSLIGVDSYEYFDNTCHNLFELSKNIGLSCNIPENDLSEIDAELFARLLFNTVFNKSLDLNIEFVPCELTINSKKYLNNWFSKKDNSIIIKNLVDKYNINETFRQIEQLFLSKNSK